LFTLAGLVLGCARRPSYVHYADVSDLKRVSGDLSAEDDLPFSIASSMDKPVDLARLYVNAIRARDVQGKECRWKLMAIPDSLYGPGLHFTFDARGAAGPVEAEVMLDYRGTTVRANAKWEKRKPARWQLISCEIRPL
jgi:hypothetical protein